MKAGRASDTALLIARSLLLAELTPSLATLPPAGSAALTRRLLAVTEPARWFDFALRHRWARRGLFLAERALLPGVFVHYFVRKRLLDAFAHEALASGCRQLVVLGAGLDTLSWRVQHAQPACACFELDHPATQAIKQRAFARERAGSVPILLAADFAHTSPAELLRTQLKFDIRVPTLFVAEGLLMYLPPERVSALLAELATFSAPGSRLAFSFMESRPGRPLAFHNGRRLVNAWLRWRNEPFRWGLARADVAPFAEQRGWRLDQLSSPATLRATFLAPHGLAHASLAVGESVALLTKSA